MKNQLKVILLCMLCVGGYQTSSAGTIPGDYRDKRIVISRVTNCLRNPRHRDTLISPIMVGFAPRAISRGIDQPPLVYDNFFCAQITWGYKAEKFDYLRTDPPSENETVKAYLFVFQESVHSSCRVTTSARAIFTVTTTDIIYDDDGPARIHAEIKDYDSELGETKPYVDITLVLNNDKQPFSIFGPRNPALNLTE